MQQDEFVRLRVGEQFQVNLSEFGAAGYQWLSQVSDPNVLTVSRRPYEPSTGTGVRPGDSVSVQFVITAQSPGVATVIFEHKRPWERDVVVAQHRVEVTVLGSTP